MLQFLMLFVSFALAAPQPQNKDFEHTLFAIHSQKTDWELAPLPLGAENVMAVFRSPIKSDKTVATLTVRSEKSEQTTLIKYVQKWTKEYPKFGYNVLVSRPYKLSGRDAYILDLLSRDKLRQVRQVITEQNQMFLLFTCMDKTAEFAKTANSCNQIIQSVSWKSIHESHTSPLQ